MSVDRAARGRPVDAPPAGKAAVLEHRSLPETLRVELRRQILTAELSAGTRLVETALAEDFGVSRATVREAVRELAQEGLVEIVPRRYSVVTRMSFDVARDVCYARAALEVAALRVLRRPDRAALAEPMTKILSAMDEAAHDGDLPAIVDLDTTFHALMIDLSGLRRLRELWWAMDGQMGGLIRASIDRQGMQLGDIRQRHEPVREAVVSGTSRQAEKAIYDHYVIDLPSWSGPGSRTDDS